jgi:hypothetical protein
LMKVLIGRMIGAVFGLTVQVACFECFMENS